MRQNQIFNAKVIEDSNRGFSLFRKGILKSKRPTGMSLCCLFTHATGYQAPPPIFLLTGKICLRNSFLISKTYRVYRFFFFWNFLSPVAGVMKCSPMGSHLILFLFYILPQVTFLTSKTYRVYRVFWPLNFLSHVAGAM